MVASMMLVGVVLMREVWLMMREEWLMMHDA